MLRADGTDDGLQKGEIEVFAAGSYPQGTFTNADIAHLADAYDAKLHRAPIYYDHQRESDGVVRGPAHGWFESFRAAGSKLIGKVANASETLLNDMTTGRRLAWSAEIYRNLAGRGLYPRAMAMLGASPPQVKGLQHALFSDDGEPFTVVKFEEPAEEAAQEDVTVTDAEKAAKAAEDAKKEADAAAARAKAEAEQAARAEFGERLTTTERELADAKAKLDEERNLRIQREAALLHDNVAAFAESEKAAGRLVPDDLKDGSLIAFMEALGNVTFKVGEKETNALAYFKEHVRSRKPLPIPGRLAGQGNPGASAPGSMRTNGDGQRFDPASVSFNERVEALVKEKGCSFEDAFNEVNETLRVY